MVHEVSVNEERIITGKNGVALVASKSEQGGWHVVKDGACDCKGYHYRRRCRHIVAVQTAIDPGHAAYVAEWEREERANVEFALAYAQ